MFDPAKRNEKWGLPRADDEPGDYIVELNLAFAGGLGEAARGFLGLHGEVLGGRAVDRPPLVISKSYYRCRLTTMEIAELAARDEMESDPRRRFIYRIWPDFPVRAQMDHSTCTIKADAAVRAYNATGEGIVWAVIDSGIDASHIHFGLHNTLLDPAVARLHRDFTAAVPSVDSALLDDYGHGTHVAGIIAGGLDSSLVAGRDFRVFERVFKAGPNGQSHTLAVEPRRASACRMRGVAPECKLVSLKALDANGRGSTSNIMLALRYIREELNADPKMPRIHGVNLSLGYEFDAEMFACGQSPLCVEVDRLVKTGVVVVVAAGNTGYGQVNAFNRCSNVGLSNSINDPGNAELAITVGATHRDSPHRYGVSFFSSKGPTGDGRLKPDLVAPGERITSAVAPAQFRREGIAAPESRLPAYLDDSGTSMAAAHVSGAIAAFLSIRREFIQRPEEVKRIFLESATRLGREPYFEGHGLLDLMRAIQSV